MEDTVLLRAEEGHHQVINLVFKYLNSSCKFRGNLLLEDSVRP